MTPKQTARTRCRWILAFLLVFAFSACSKVSNGTTSGTDSAAQPGALAGRVTGSFSGKGLEGAVISVSPGQFGDTTDAFGIFTLLAIPEGSYTLTVTLSGYRPDTVEVLVTAGITAVRSVGLSGLPPTDGMVLYLPFNNSVADESPSHLPMAANQVFLTSDRYGRASKAFIAQGAFIDAGNNALLNPMQSITVAGWIYKTARTYGDLLTRWESKAYAQPQRAYDLGIGPDYAAWNVSSNGFDSGVASVQSNGGTVPLNAWTFLVGTWDGGSVRLYLNGELVGTAPLSAMASSPNVRTGIHAVLGRPEDPTLGSLDGFLVLDDVRIYDRALTNKEIYSLFEE
jgi:hypothetical protein